MEAEELETLPEEYEEAIERQEQALLGVDPSPAQPMVITTIVPSGITGPPGPTAPMIIPVGPVTGAPPTTTPMMTTRAVARTAPITVSVPVPVTTPSPLPAAAAAGVQRGPRLWNQDPAYVLRQLLRPEAIRALEYASVVISGSNLSSLVRVDVPVEWREEMSRINRILAEPPPLEAYGTIPRGGAPVLHLKNTWVITELNMIFGPQNWSSRVVELMNVGGPTVFGSRMILQVRWPNGATTVQEDEGTHVAARADAASMPTAIKGAVSSALKRCARKLGNHFIAARDRTEKARIIAEIERGGRA